MRVLPLIQSAALVVNFHLIGPVVVIIIDIVITVRINGNTSGENVSDGSGSGILLGSNLTIASRFEFETETNIFHEVGALVDGFFNTATAASFSLF